MKIDIEDEHSLQYIYKLIKNKRQIIIIRIAEAEPDIRYLYREYLKGRRGLEVEIVENGSKCIEYLFDSKELLNRHIVKELNIVLVYFTNSK